jgi:hypothetical protein
LAALHITDGPRALQQQGSNSVCTALHQLFVHVVWSIRRGATSPLLAAHYSQLLLLLLPLPPFPLHMAAQQHRAPHT